MTEEEKKQEQEMLAAFREQARNIILSQDKFVKNNNTLRVGFESEVAIYKENLALRDIERIRNKIIQEVPDITDTELGAAQIELRTPPIDALNPSGFNELAKIYKDEFKLLVQAAKKQNCSILRIGANPFLPIKDTPRTNKLKYRLVPDYYNQHRPKEADTIIGLGKNRVDIGDAAIVSLFQSFQVNVEAKSLNDACSKMNRTLFIAPYLLAISANARFLEFIDTKLQDMRMTAWEKSHDTRMSDIRMISWEKSFDLRPQERFSERRIGLPKEYFMSIVDYFKRMEKFPFILYQPDEALKIAVGMTWLDARVKFIENSAVVELRLLPTQPTIEEELLLTLLYIGRLSELEIRKGQLLPFPYVRENRISAMLYGPHKKMWFIMKDGTVKKLPYKLGMKSEIHRAKLGLAYLGLAELLDIDLLQDKLLCSPSDKLAKKLYRDGGKISKAKMAQSLKKTKMLI